MSHFATLVIVDRPVDRSAADDAVEPLLAPYSEEDEWFRDGSRWDWWQVGGRWTGAIAGDAYDPEEDLENIEVCLICGGTGRRPDADKFEAQNPGWIAWSGGCNGCRGKGVSQKWPTSWKDFDGDVRPVREIQFKTYRGEGEETRFLPAAVVTPDGKWHEQARMGWFGQTIEDEDGNDEKSNDLWRATVAALLEQHPDAYAIVVDCHV